MKATVWSKTARKFRRKKPTSSKKAFDAQQCKNNSTTLSAGDAFVFKMPVEEAPNAESVQPDVCKNNSSDTELSHGPSASGEEIAQMPSYVSNDIFETDDEEGEDDDDEHGLDEHVATEEAAGDVTEAVVVATVDGEGNTTDEAPSVVVAAHVDSCAENNSSKFPKLETMMLERVKAINRINKLLRHVCKDHGE